MVVVVAVVAITGGRGEGEEKELRGEFEKKKEGEKGCINQGR